MGYSLKGHKKLDMIECVCTHTPHAHVRGAWKQGRGGEPWIWIKSGTQIQKLTMASQLWETERNVVVGSSELSLKGT